MLYLKGETEGEENRKRLSASGAKVGPEAGLAAGRQRPSLAPEAPLWYTILLLFLGARAGGKMSSARLRRAVSLFHSGTRFCCSFWEHEPEAK